MQRNFHLFIGLHHFLPRPPPNQYYETDEPSELPPTTTPYLKSGIGGRVPLVTVRGSHFLEGNKGICSMNSKPICPLGL
jgi:hypothetical protein